MIGFLKSNRQQLGKDLKNVEVRRFFSPALLVSHSLVTPAIDQYARGKMIDIGCGDMPYKQRIERKVESYDTLDVEARCEGVKFIGDATNMHMIANETYDTMICLEVLEHISDPFAAVQEMARILKPGASLILSVPHLSRYHELPHDYYRYTKYGLKAMLEKHGFEIIEMNPTGSMLTFIGHQFASVVNCLFWGMPVVKWIVFYLNKFLCVYPCFLIDRLFRKKTLFPLGHVCVAKKVG